MSKQDSFIESGSSTPPELNKLLSRNDSAKSQSKIQTSSAGRNLSSARQVKNSQGSIAGDSFTGKGKSIKSQSLSDAEASPVGSAGPSAKSQKSIKIHTTEYFTGLGLSKMTPTCSKVRPLVSGTNHQMVIHWTKL
ncbi:hypothetical protein HK096_000912 [Nowakowskiella sp. JEL0078]|nr:hypothetical protein HK096_000912 [Nowakowskiella sp. JEL0078]